MAKRLYVGNLAFAATSAEVRVLFERYGAVGAVEIMNDPATGRSRGFAFVTMPDDAEADEAVYRVDGTELRNRRLNVNEAQPKLPPADDRLDDRRGPGRGPTPARGFDRPLRPGADGRFQAGPRARPTPGPGLGLGERLRGRGERP